MLANLSWVVWVDWCVGERLGNQIDKLADMKRFGFMVNRSVLCAIICLCAHGWVFGQTDQVIVRINTDGVGVGGVVRPGGWTPMQVTLDNQSAEARSVRCEWIFADADGDMVYAQRRFSLSPQRVGQGWLYAMPTIHTDARSLWRLKVIDEKLNKVVATEQFRPADLLDIHTGVIGITGSRELGLRPYTTDTTQHEKFRLILGIDPANLPDRWYGLSMMQALIWTPQGGDPSSGSIPPDSHRALRQWVRRGGHLVVVLPMVGDDWFNSPLRSLLEPIKVGQAVQAKPPVWLGRKGTGGDSTINVRLVRPADGYSSRVSLLLRDEQGRPTVAGWAHGFGRVTVVGVDLSAPSLAQMGLPNGRWLWSSVFGWRSPAFSNDYIDQEVQEQRMTKSTYRRHVALDQFIPGRIVMRQEATSALLAAMGLFVVYWLLAGPISFAGLKKRGLERHSWVVFVVIVGVVSMIAWGGAWLMKPGRTAVAHFTVLDVEGASDLARGRSWLSLVVPKHGRVGVAIGSDEDLNRGNTLGSPGLDPSGDEAAFLDQQSYRVDATTPDRAEIPIRATAKQFELDYWGRLDELAGESGQAGQLPGGQLHLQNGWPAGTVVHQLSGSLENVLIVYCPGNGQAARVWRLRDPWAPGVPLKLDPPAKYEMLVDPNTPRYDFKGQRSWNKEGYLGQLISAKTGQAWGTEENVATMVADDQVVQAIEMLSFYDTLPPPDYLRGLEVLKRATHYDRALGRSLDLSALTALKCVIVIGHLEQGPLPIPLVVDGKVVDSEGWMVVRWIGGLDD